MTTRERIEAIQQGVSDDGNAAYYAAIYSDELRWLCRLALAQDRVIDSLALAYVKALRGSQ